MDRAALRTGELDNEILNSKQRLDVGPQGLGSNADHQITAAVVASSGLKHANLWS